MSVYCFKLHPLQIKDNRLTRVEGEATKGEVGGEEVGGASLMATTSDPTNMQAVDELKRAFELVEVANPGLSDLLVRKIVQHLQQW